MIESHGIPTVTLGLVRPHLEATAPPRALFVPFVLGRPLGEPEDGMFQTAVLRQALGLFERDDGPVILEDFVRDAPSQSAREGWQPAIDLPEGDLDPAAVAAEIAAVVPHWRRAIIRFGRTTVGITPLSPTDMPGALWPFLAGGPVDSPVPGLGPALALRFIADDLKALYSEAAQADGPQPGVRQVDRWFWSRTLAGRLLVALRRAGMANGDNSIRAFSTRFLVPAPYLPDGEPR